MMEVILGLIILSAVIVATAGIVVLLILTIIWLVMVKS
jgi:hypothetical protein